MTAKRNRDSRGAALIGRPPRKGHASVGRFELRCTEEELEALRERARILGLTMADYIRARVPELR